MPKIPYNKIALSYFDQIDQLLSRGLYIQNKEKAHHLLQQISYYRLSGYWYPLLEDPKERHKFKYGASFDAAFSLYCFDRELRSFILAELKKIEISVRSKIGYEFWENYDAFWYLDFKHFNSKFKHEKWIQKVEEYVEKSDEDIYLILKYLMKNI